MGGLYLVLDGGEFLPEIQELSLEGGDGLQVVSQLLSRVFLLESREGRLTEENLKHKSANPRRTAHARYH